jgi:hypothetical protein
MGNDSAKDPKPVVPDAQPADDNPHFGGGKSDFALKWKWDERTQHDQKLDDQNDHQNKK